jgi:hypothetical protein
MKGKIWFDKFSLKILLILTLFSEKIRISSLMTKSLIFSILIDYIQKLEGSCFVFFKIDNEIFFGSEFFNGRLNLLFSKLNSLFPSFNVSRRSKEVGLFFNKQN